MQPRCAEHAVGRLLLKSGASGEAPKVALAGDVSAASGFVAVGARTVQPRIQQKGGAWNCLAWANARSRQPLHSSG
jgi:hypothetical protein